MNATPASLSENVQLGDPIAHRGIVVVPLFPRRSPRTEYLTLDMALPRGFVVEETDTHGSVPELVVRNPLDERVLLYDGEELVGAKQNRILNVSVLVEGKASLTIPVSCVEEGRWSRISERFGVAAHAAHPELRRRKAESLALRPLARGVAQGEVWEAVAEKAARMHVRSPTRSNADTFQAYASDLRELEDAFPLVSGQSGALLAVGETTCLDWVSRPDAFADLWSKIRRGYLLDALEHLDTPAVDAELIGTFLEAAAASPTTLGPTPGLGGDLRLRGEGAVGSGLELDGELVQLSVFASQEGPRVGRIARPTRRRP